MSSNPVQQHPTNLIVVHRFKFWEGLLLDCCNLLPMNFVLRFLFLFVFRAYGMEPLALLATQGHWQAAQPIVVNVDYDGEIRHSCVCTWAWVFDIWACSPGIRHKRRDGGLEEGVCYCVCNSKAGEVAGPSPLR